MAGGRHSMILMANGSLLAFGFGAFGQLGVGVVKNFYRPQYVKSFMKNNDEFIV